VLSNVSQRASRSLASRLAHTDVTTNSPSATLRHGRFTSLAHVLAVTLGACRLPYASSRVISGGMYMVLRRGWRRRQSGVYTGQTQVVKDRGVSTCIVMGWTGVLFLSTKNFILKQIVWVIYYKFYGRLGLISLGEPVLCRSLSHTRSRRRLTSDSTSPADMCSNCAASRAPLAFSARTPCTDATNFCLHPASSGGRARRNNRGNGLAAARKQNSLVNAHR